MAHPLRSWLKRRPSPTRPIRRQPAARLGVLDLESRLTPAAFTPSIMNDPAIATATAADVDPTSGQNVNGPYAGEVSLRSAIIASNLNGATPDTIRLGIGTYTLQLAGAGEDAALTGDLDVLGSLTVS